MDEGSSRFAVHLFLSSAGAISLQLLRHPGEKSHQVLVAAVLHEHLAQTLHKPAKNKRYRCQFLLLSLTKSLSCCFCTPHRWEWLRRRQRYPHSWGPLQGSQAAGREVSVEGLPGVVEPSGPSPASCRRPRRPCPPQGRSSSRGKTGK